ncbi:ABC transporter substrate-binding protein [Streptomyces sp. NBC_01497]|uniref:ABC transporter substrate-binding protein n=1 Tax=Streptomyces sp. NBC_01497 TaxID=2903885 RepID=UPI002E30B0B2|nr:extracellular solute-binding protein [Streptomyces sp. NBC_01497]
MHPGRVDLGRRRLLTGMAGLAAAGGLAGCVRGSSTSTVPGAVNLYNDNATWTAGYEKAGAVLKRVTGYALRPLSNASTTSYQEVVQTSTETDKAADVAKWANGYALYSLARRGGLSDLSDAWDAARAQGWVSAGLRPAVSYEGKVYGMPLYQSSYVVFYAKAVFAKYRLEVPTTWDELMHNAAVLKRNGVTPFLGTQSGTWPAFEWFEELVSKLDPDFYTRLVAGRARYTDDTVVEAMDIWRGLIAKGYMTSPDFDQANGPAQMKSGKLAMFLHGSWEAAAIGAGGLRPDIDYGAFILPTVHPGTKASVITESGVLVVPRRAADHKGAMAAVQGWLDPRVQRVWSDFLQDSSANPTVRPSNPVVRSIQQDITTHGRQLLTRYNEASPPNLIQGNILDLGNFMIHPSEAKSTLRSMQARADTEWDLWRKGGQ